MITSRNNKFFKGRFSALLFGAALALCAASAQAATKEGEWTKSTWTEFTASPDAISRPKYLAEGQLYTNFALCDGCSAPFDFHGNCEVVWNFPRKATLTGIKMYSNHGDNGRDDIRLSYVQVRYTADGEWVTLPNSGVTHNHTSDMQKKLFAGFAAPDGYSLAEDVVAVKLVFPAQENGWINFVEAELLGSLEPSSEPEEESPYVWEVGGYQPGTWTPLVAESNMMAYCSSIQINDTVTSSYNFMTDKSVARVDNNSAFVANGNTITWLFAQPFNLYSFRVFSRWNDGGRDDISIWKFETRDENGVWTVRTDAENHAMVGTGKNINTTAGTVGSNYAILRRSDGEPIASAVTGVRVLPYYHDFPPCWAEVEAEGAMPLGPAILDERSVTVSNDCFKVDWTAQLSSLGASESATVNLWTSTNGVDYSLADSAIVTETGVDYAFTKTFDAVDLTISYRFETINTSATGSWCSTNEVATFVNYDNAVYYWRPEVASGSWEDVACWSNSLNDARLLYPSQQYATASFALLDPATPVEVTVGASHTVRFQSPASSAAMLTLKGSSSVTLQIASVTGSLKGTNIIDGLVAKYSRDPAFADDARVKLQNGAKCYIKPADLNGARAGIELYSGAKLNIYSSGHSLFFCKDFEIVLDGGTVENAGYFAWSGNGSPNRGHIVFRPGGGQFLASSSHSMLYGSDALCEIRYELPGGSWSGYTTAPLRPGDVNVYHPFGRVDGSNGKFLVNVVFGADSPRRELELPLIRKTDSKTIITNNFDFAAFGADMDVNVPNKKGDYFYWTYGENDTTKPAAAGDLPTGLSFHYAGRSIGFTIIVR